MEHGRELSVNVSRALVSVSQRFGYIELQPCQQTTVTQFVVTRKDMFLSLPTGYGKSFVIPLYLGYLIIYMGNSLPITL